MLMNLLNSAASATENSAAGGAKGGGWGSYVMLALVLVLVVVFFVLNSRSSKKRQKETQDMLDAIRPGCKVKTIGGICGIVVDVNPDENTFVLETGTEATGKSYLKFDKQAVYQTDAVAQKTQKAELSDEKASEKATEEAEEKAAENPEGKTEETETENKD